MINEEKYPNYFPGNDKYEVRFTNIYGKSATISFWARWYRDPSKSARECFYEDVIPNLTTTHAELWMCPDVWNEDDSNGYLIDSFDRGDNYNFKEALEQELEKIKNRE